MEYCQNCGHKLNPGQQFCPECGNVQKTAAPVPDTPSAPQRVKETNRKPSFFQSKGFKILAAIVVVLVIALFGAYKYIASTLTPDKIETKFVDAVKNQNVKEMKQIINHNQTDLTITDESISNFFAYFKKHPDVFSQTVEQLKKDASNLAVNQDYDNRKDPVNVVKDGKQWLIFDYYAINLKPYYVKVETNKTPVELSINGKSAGKLSDKKATFGPYLLSDIKVEGTYNAKYASVTDHTTLDPSEEDSQNLNANLDFTGHTVTISSDNSDAILYVNGQSTGKKIGDIDTFGPVKIDGSMKLQAVLKVGSHTVESNEETITEDGQEIDLEIPATDFDGEDTAGTVASDSSVAADTDGIGQVVSDHYQDISNGDYQAAYNLMSAARRAQYSFADWQKGLANNYRNDVAISDVQKLDDTNAVVSFNLTSYDRNSDGSTLVQEWGGKWNLVYENGQWVLNKPDISKIDSYTE